MSTMMIYTQNLMNENTIISNKDELEDHTIGSATNLIYSKLLYYDIYSCHQRPMSTTFMTLYNTLFLSHPSNAIKMY